MLYKSTNYYAPKLERSILWSDPEIAIEWSLVSEIKIASKDEAGSILAQAEVYI
jgi:dTDP-4-dehydrorhamnose 3,5-epimerase